MQNTNKQMLKRLLSGKYHLDEGEVDSVAGLLSILAEAQKMPAEEYITGLFGNCSHLCYFIWAPDKRTDIKFPSDLLFQRVKRVFIIISAMDPEEARKTEDYLGGMLYSSWEGNKNIVTVKRRSFLEPLTVDLIIAGDEPLISKRRERTCDRRQPDNLVKKIPVPCPKDIYAALDNTILGQKEAKKSLSVILYQHLKRQALIWGDRGIDKANALLIGPTGCGKTLLAKTLADIADVPFLRIDATAMVQRGYRGGIHVEQMVNLLFSAAHDSKSRAEYGIIFIDEVDKIACCGPNAGEIATEGVQQDLLSVIDGEEIFYEPDDECEYIRRRFNFNNVLFLFSGAFSRLKDHEEVSQKELVGFGFMPEFANRMGNIIRLEPLSDELIRKLVQKEVEEYHYYLPLSSAEKNAFTEIIHSVILASKSHLEMGGRCVAPAVRRFFEDRIFELGCKKVKSDGEKEEK